MSDMRKIRNASLLAAGFALAAGSLAACGDSGKAPEANDGGAPIEIQYIHRLPDDEGMTKVADIVAKWNEEHPDIQVTATKFDGAASDLIQRIETDVNANNAPCLAQVGYGEITQLYVKGILEDVTSEAEKYASNFADGPVSLMSADGKSFGLPQDVGPLVYYYDAAAFEELGLEVPKTTDELISTAKAAAEKGKYILSFQPDEFGNMFSAFGAASGDSWFTIEDGSWKVDLGGEGTKTVVDTWQKLLDDGSVLTTPRWDDAWSAKVADGTLIGTIGAAWEGALIAPAGEGSPNAGKWAVVEMPDWFGNKGMTGPDGGSGVAVIKGCEHPAEAMEFNNWFNTQVDDLATQGLVLAATTATPATPENYAGFFGGGEDPMKVFAAANEHMSDKLVYIPGWPAVAAATSEPAAAATNGTGTVQQVIDITQKTAISTLKDLGLPLTE
ncbi:extracellular solute-binding protein [Gleimia europaea]|nr:extracellular solute-binding protein [Gleimia europaea]MDK8534577.1 extracellular solute-binding protein [Gleimia europaea]